jgi:hypothetical protein
VTQPKQWKSEDSQHESHDARRTRWQAAALRPSVADDGRWNGRVFAASVSTSATWIAKRSYALATRLFNDAVSAA